MALRFAADPVLCIAQEAVMSEALRSRLYDWFCEHIDEPTAEYAMSCLSPVPVSELATKDDIERLETAFERLGTATRKDIERLDTKFERLGTATRKDIERLDTKFERLGTATRKDIERLDTKFERLGTATRKDIERLDTKFERLDTKFERLVDAREADRKEARHQFHWLVGIVVAIHGVSVSALGVILGSGVFS